MLVSMKLVLREGSVLFCVMQRKHGKWKFCLQYPGCIDDNVLLYYLSDILDSQMFDL